MHLIYIFYFDMILLCISHLNNSRTLIYQHLSFSEMMKFMHDNIFYTRYGIVVYYIDSPYFDYLYMQYDY